MSEESASQTSGGRQKRIKRTEVRQRLLQAAFKVFAQFGYAGASLEKVADTAGFSKGAVYSNFSSKDELFFELVAKKIDDRAELVQKAMEQHSLASSKPVTIEQMARQIGSELNGLGAADPQWQIMFIEFWVHCAKNPSLRSKLAEKRMTMRRGLAEIISIQSSALNIVINQEQALDLATILLALSNGLGIENLLDQGTVRPELFGDLLAMLFIQHTSSK